MDVGADELGPLSRRELPDATVVDDVEGVVVGGVEQPPPLAGTLTSSFVTLIFGKLLFSLSIKNQTSIKHLLSNCPNNITFLPFKVFYVKMFQAFVFDSQCSHLTGLHKEANKFLRLRS